eukprot:m.136509 g.136509  ORF g.136509 m.136509 type:complete len:882 (+) comp11437_c0_seq1:197-2842(+)
MKIALTDSLMGALIIDLSHNNMESCPIFGSGEEDTSPGATTRLFLDVSRNKLNTSAISFVLYKFSSSTLQSMKPPFTMLAAGNNCTSLPDHFLEHATTNSGGFPSGLTLDLSYNPIQSLSESVFIIDGDIDSSYFTPFFSTVRISVAHSTAGPIAYPPNGFNFTARSFTSNAYLQFDATNTSVTHAGTVVSAFARFLQPSACGPTCTLSIGLAHNRITSIASGELASVALNALDLSGQLLNLSGQQRSGHDGSAAHTSTPQRITTTQSTTTTIINSDGSGGALTYIAPDAFNNAMTLTTLILSNNALTFLSIDVLANTPALSHLAVDGNPIEALPFINNHLNTASNTTGFVVQCATFGSNINLTDCACTPGSNLTMLSLQCGYIRCTHDRDGCPPGYLLNASDCSQAPASVCVDVNSPRYINSHQYYDTAQHIFLPLTNCSTAFKAANRPGLRAGYKNAWEYTAPTATSDRVCAICTTCPSEYGTIPCTPTTDSVCTRVGLTPVAIAGITVALTAVIVLGVVVAGYYRRRKEEKERELVQTTMALGTERQAVARMTQAWVICEDDLKFDAVIGIGASGVVHKGKWGYINVAIKLLTVPMQPVQSGIFEGELEFLQSVRHPHVLTFYGAGIIEETQQSYLVTELMAGSLQAVLSDMNQVLSWALRLQLADDTISGLRYLHSIDIVHRDVKSDNLFVDAQRRLKVGDFGTGRLARVVNPDADPTVLPAQGRGGNRMRTFTSMSGSLLWMAPESILGHRIAPDHIKCLDMYSFGIVMWELWTRRQPWCEIEGSEACFFQLLVERLKSGRRPTVPRDAGRAPDGYAALMRDCWANDPAARPSSEVVAVRLTDIRRHNHGGVYEGEGGSDSDEPLLHNVEHGSATV